MKCHRVRSTRTREDNPSSADTNTHRGRSEGPAGCLPQGQGLSWPCHQGWVTAPAAAAAALGCHTARNSPCQGSTAQGAPAPCSRCIQPHQPARGEQGGGWALLERIIQRESTGAGSRRALPSPFCSQQAGNKTKPGPGAHQLHTQHSQTAEAASAKTQTLPAPALHTKRDLTKSIPTPEQNCQP